jgi:hypothetical protein
MEPMSRSWKPYLAGLVLVLVAAADANAAYFAARDEGRSEPAVTRTTVSRRSVSRPYLVARSCGRSRTVREACRVAIRYLRALDLDRFQDACALLARETLENAGGRAGCIATMSKAKGIRIRYGIDQAVETIVGTSIRFRTRAIDGSGPGIEQAMIVRPERGRQRIWAVMADPYAGARTPQGAARWPISHALA